MDPKSIIKDIRNKFTGENLELNKETQEIITNNNDALSRALEELSENLYKKEFHFIMELIQNAEDNSYDDDVEPYLKFILTENKLIIQNNEIGFIEENVRALCNIKKSTKKKIDGYVGEKGIGFKSVFKVSESPEIHSSGYHFRFHSSKSKKAKSLGFILPELIEDIPNDIDLNITNIILPFSKSRYKKFSEQISDIEPNLLLFLKKLKVIYIVNEVEGTQTIYRKEVSSKDIVKITNETINQWSDNNIEESYYRLFREKYKVPKGIAVDERKGVENTDVIIGFPLNKENAGYKVNSNNNCYVYNFLPINDFNFRFTIQADFILTSNREAINESKEWNTWIREKVIITLKNSFISLQNTPLWKEYLNYLPRKKEVSEAFFTVISDSIREWGCNEKTIPIKNGKDKEWTKPSKSLRFNKEIEKIYGNEIIQKRTGFHFMNPSACYHEEILTLLEIQKWKWQYEQECINDRKWFSSLTRNKREEFYEYLSIEYSNNKNVIEDIKGLKIIFIKGKENPESFNDSDDGILWPINAKMKYSFLNSVRFLAHDYRKSTKIKYKRICDLFRKIGVKDPNVQSIIKEYILPKYEEGNDINKAGKELNKYHKEFIYFIYSYLKTIKKESTFFKSLKDAIWLYSSDKDFKRPRILYLDTNYDRFSVWDSIFLKSEVSFLAPGYLAGEIKGKNTKNIVKFFYELGLKEQAIIEDFIKVFNSGNFDRIKRLLIFLNNNWNNYSKNQKIDQIIKSIKIPINDELYFPNELFVDSQKNRSILGDSVKYIPQFISNKEFIKDLKVNNNIIPSGYLIELLRDFKSSNKKRIDKKHLSRIYSEFKNNSEIKDVFAGEALLYSFRDKEWFYPWQIVWSININQFADLFVEFSSQYSSELLQFFLNAVGIHLNIQIDNVVKYLEDISERGIHSEIEKNRIESAIGFIAENLKNRQINIVDIDEIIDEAIYPSTKLELYDRDEIYFADNNQLFEIFKSTEIPIFNLSIENSGFKNLIISAAIDLKLKLLSGHYKTDYIIPLKIKKDSSFTEDLKEIIGTVSYILFYRSKEIYIAFENLFLNIEKIRVYPVHQLIVNYQLDDAMVQKEEIFFVKDNKIYINNTTKDRLLLIADIIINLLDNNLIVKDFILYVISENPNQLFYYMETHNIPKPKVGHDLKAFAKRNKKKVSPQLIINFENNKDEKDITEEEKEASSINRKDEGSKGQSDKIINVSVTEFIPEINPDFEVQIEEVELTENQGGIEGFDSKIKKSEAFHRYKFSSDITYEKEIGNWGEEFVFNNLAKELCSEYKNSKLLIDKDLQKLSIIDTAGKENASLENRNVQGLSQGGYDLLLKKGNKTSFIEVKSTTRSGETKFNLEESQWECCRQNQSEFVLIIVRNAGKKTATIEQYNNLYKMYSDGLVSIKPGRMSLFI